MNYSRYLDIHLCTSYLASDKLNKYRGARFSSMYIGGGRYFYQFTHDIMRQMRYRESKAEGFTFNNDNKGNCKILEDVELTDADDQWLVLNSTLDTTGGGSRVSYSIKDELKQLRYVGCMVSIEHLQTNDVYPQLRSLMLWISDPGTRNKLRINCHGSGTRTGGMTMGGGNLSPEQLVSALVRHGLTRPSSHIASAHGLAQNARWKLDKEGDKCEGCFKKFEVYRRRHHCRRCGGLFCDTCSSKKADLKVALTGEKGGNVTQQSATAYNVKNARVCNACYTAVTSPAARALAEAEDPVFRDVFGESVAKALGQPRRTDFGLTTITLALCLGARADDEYSPERNPSLFGPQPAATTFVGDSLASRLLAALRDPNHNLRGIKVAASNQVLKGSDKGIKALSEVNYPTSSRPGGIAVTNGFPAYVWGTKRTLKTQMDTTFIQFSQDIRVAPDGRAVYFSSWPGTTNTALFFEHIFGKWSFTSWQITRDLQPPLPGATAVLCTLRLTAPPRVQRIRLIQGAPGQDNDKIELTVRNTGVDEIEMFKHYQSYDVS